MHCTPKGQEGERYIPPIHALFSWNSDGADYVTKQIFVRSCVPITYPILLVPPDNEKLRARRIPSM